MSAERLTEAAPLAGEERAVVGSPALAANDSTRGASPIRKAAELMVAGGDVRLLSSLEAAAEAMRDRAAELDRIGRCTTMTRAAKVARLSSIAGGLAQQVAMEAARAVSALEDIDAAILVAAKAGVGAEC